MLYVLTGSNNFRFESTKEISNFLAVSGLTYLDKLGISQYIPNAASYTITTTTAGGWFVSYTYRNPDNCSYVANIAAVTNSGSIALNYSQNSNTVLFLDKNSIDWNNLPSNIHTNQSTPIFTGNVSSGAVCGLATVSWRMRFNGNITFQTSTTWHLDRGMLFFEQKTESILKFFDANGLVILSTTDYQGISSNYCGVGITYADNTTQFVDTAGNCQIQANLSLIEECPDACTVLDRIIGLF